MFPPSIDVVYFALAVVPELPNLVPAHEAGYVLE